MTSLTHQYKCSKNVRKAPFSTGSRNLHFDQKFGSFGSKYRASMHLYSQKSIGRSGNWHKVKIFRKPPFVEIWLKFFHLSLLLLNLDLRRGSIPFWCLSNDWSRDTVKTKTLPIVSLSFFCELSVYVACDTSNWSLETTDLRNNHFETNWSSDRKLE